MAYKDFTSELTCTFCGNKFETSNVRMKRVLCGTCQRHSKTIDKYADGRSYSQLPEEVKQSIYKDPTVRYQRQPKRQKTW